MPLLDKLFPGFLDARREWARRRPRHFRPLAGAWAPPPAPFDDRAAADLESINAHSCRYFERDDLRAFWMNKPFSDGAWTGWVLSRFGQLLTALDLRPGDRVLDFGCGTGWSSIMLARMGMQVTGMDISPAALDLARAGAARALDGLECPPPTFATYGGGRLDAADGHFDAIVVFDAFHHLPNPRQVMGEFARVLAPNARLGMAEPGIGHADESHSQAEMDHGVLELELDLEQLSQSALAAGFKGMEVVVPGLHPHAMTLPMRRLRWFMRGWSWLVPADQLRLAILRAPIALFWKGPHFLSSLHPRDQSAIIRPAVAAIDSRPGEAFTLRATVTNTRATVWLREGRHGRGYVRLGAHLLGQDGRTIEHDYARGGLPCDVARGEQVLVELSCVAPADRGVYVLRLDMVNEGIGWFAENQSATTDVALTVR